MPALPKAEAATTRAGLVGRCSLGGASAATFAAPFGYTYLPNGFTVQGVTAMEASDGFPPSFGYVLGASTVPVAEPVTIMLQSDLPPDKMTRGKTVQGYQSEWVTYRDGSSRLVLLDVLNGQHIVIGGPIPVAEMYTIAEGLILP